MDLQINQRIKKYRKEKKLNQKITAELLGVKHSTYSQMERKGGIHIDIAIKLAKIFEVDPDLIIYGERKTLDFSPIIPPKKLTANEPKEIDKLFENNFTLTNREKDAISIIRNVTPEDREEIYEFIGNKFINRKK